MNHCLHHNLPRLKHCLAAREADNGEEKAVPVWKLQTFDMVAKKKNPRWLENLERKKESQLITALGNIVNNSRLCVMTSNV